jgi:hypothetical protein
MNINIFDIQSIDSHCYLSTNTDYGDETMVADYSDPGFENFQICYCRELDIGDSIDCCGIIGSCYVIIKVRCPIPHINLNYMLVEVACRICDIET